ncbi:MAG: hypothetical protein FJ271_26715 [Planctomycetes bacterium]|nr:hypothetical protein [Planctomycetota bacterium]
MTSALLALTALLVAVLVLRWNAPAKTDDNDGDIDGPAVRAVAAAGRDGNGQRMTDAGLPPLPEMLKKRPLHVPLPLQDLNHEPIWRDARLAGKGKRWPQITQLCLLDFDKQERTLFALDNDPQRHWFRFAIDVNQLLDKDKRDRNAIGIFFGWRPVAEAGDVPHRFYAIQLDEQPLVGFPHGQLNIGIGRIDTGHKLRLPATEWFFPLPMGKSILALEKSLSWHHLEVEALDQRVKITVDTKSLEFNLNWLRQQDLYQDAPDPRGAVGIWCGNGQAFCRNATTMALAR